MIAAILSLIPAPVVAALLGMAAAAFAVVVAWLKGRSNGARGVKAKAAEKAADDYKRVTEAMQNADTGNHDGSGDFEWLRDRGKR